MWHEWSPMKKLIWLRRFASGASYILKTVTGAIVHITDAIAGAVEALSVAIEPVQDLHGYDNPWPAGGGKNLAECTAPSQTVNGVSYVVNNDGTVTANGTASSVALLVYGSVELKAGSYKLNGLQSNGSNTTFSVQLMEGATVKTASESVADAPFDVENDTTYTLRLVVRQGYTASNLVFKPMIRLATETDSTFAPYSNECPITGFSAVNLWRTGVNMLDDGYSTSVTNEIVLTEGTYYAQAWLLENPSQHTTNPQLLIDGVWTTITPPYSGDGISIAGRSFGWLYSNATQTITVEAGKKYSIRYNRNNTAMQTRRLSFSTTELSTFEEYQGNTYTIQLGQTVYGGTLDVVNGTMTVDRVKIDVSSLSKNSPTSFYFIPQETLQANEYNAISDKVKTAKNPSDVGVYVNYGGAIRLNTAEEYASTADCLSALGGTFAVVAKLATPIEITLTPVQISTLQGTNNVWSDAGDVTMTYRASAS